MSHSILSQIDGRLSWRGMGAASHANRNNESIWKNSVLFTTYTVHQIHEEIFDRVFQDQTYDRRRAV
jgi:hypothetical protein